MTDPNTQVPPQVPPKHPGADKKMTAALCGILVGAFGVHKFFWATTRQESLRAV
jgi:hypothetical protein